MLNLLWYLLIGIGAFVFLSIDELILMRTNGISLDYYFEFCDEFGIDDHENSRWCNFAMAWGVVVWPVRVFTILSDRNRRLDKIAEWVKNKKEEPDSGKKLDRQIEELISDLKEISSKFDESDEQES